MWQGGPEGRIFPIEFWSGSFKDAEKLYLAWEKGLFVISLALQEGENTTWQQSFYGGLLQLETSIGMNPFHCRRCTQLQPRAFRQSLEAQGPRAAQSRIPPVS